MPVDKRLIYKMLPAKSPYMYPINKPYNFMVCEAGKLVPLVGPVEEAEAEKKPQISVLKSDDQQILQLVPLKALKENPLEDQPVAIFMPPIQFAKPIKRLRKPVKRLSKQKQKSKRSLLKSVDKEDIVINLCSDDEVEETTKKLRCICNQVRSNSFMILCDTCQKWYHGDCVGITTKHQEIESEWGEFKCPSCKDVEFKNPPTQYELPVAVKASPLLAMALGVGLELPVAAEAGLELPGAPKAGLELPVAAEAGLELPVAPEAGWELEETPEVALELSLASEFDYDLPVAPEIEWVLSSTTSF